MKILMTLMGLDIGGAETHVVELSRQLKIQGHDVIIVSDGGAYLPEIERCGIRHYNAPLSSRDLRCMAKSYTILKDVIKNEKPDIVHAHARIPGFICGLIRKTVKFNFVTSTHGTYVTAKGLKFLTNWGDCSLAVSEDIKNYLIKNYKVNPENIIVSINGVDTDKFSPDNRYEDVCEEFGLEPRARRIVYMSRLNDDVCLPLLKLLDVFEDIAEKIPDIELLIIGEGNIFKDIRARANQLNAVLGRKAIVMTGARTDVSRLLSCATVCLGVARAILESMAMAKPVVIAGVEGYIGILTKENVDVAKANNFTCRGCLPIDSDILKADILSVLEADEEERSEMGKYGRRLVQADYSLDRMVEDNIKLYQMGMRRFKYDVAILGYYGYKNSGDDALLYAIVRSLRSLKPDISINVLSFNPKETAEMYNVCATYRYDVLKMFKTIKSSKLFVLGGGSLIQDVTSTKSLLYYLFVTKRAVKYGCKTMLYANGIGPVKKKMNRRRVRKVINTVDFITLRDSDSLDELKTLGVGAPGCEITADPVFCIDEDGAKSAEALLEKHGIGKDTKFACISIRKWEKCPDNFDKLCAEMADYIYEKYNLLPVFIPMQYPYDASISRSIVSKMKYKGIFISRRVDIPSTLGIVEKSSLVVSVRLHMLIYAALYGVPSVGIAYDPKVSNFLKYINQPYFLDPRAMAAGDYTHMIDKCIENKDSIVVALQKEIEEFKEKSSKSAEIAIKLLED